MSGFNRYYYIEGKHRGGAQASEMPLKDFLNTFFRRCHIDYNPYESEVKTLWEQMTGKLVKQYTQQVYINKEVLYVKLSSPTAKSELLMVKDALKNKINRELGKEILKNIMLI